MYEAARARKDVSFCEALMETLRVRCRVSPADLARIPKTGPVVVVANHPFGLLEGILLGSLLPPLRPDVKFLANSLLENVPELHDITFFVNPYGGHGALRKNLSVMKHALDWVRQGHLLVTFPAGDVAQFDWKRGSILEPAWNPATARLIQGVSASAVPLYFDGGNSPLFHMAGVVHPRLRTLLIPHELLNKQSREVEVRIGAPIVPERYKGLSQIEFTGYLRRRTLLLANRAELKGRTPKAAPVVPAIAESALQGDMEKLPPRRRLAVSGEYEVWLTTAAETPNILYEIGRLREIAFRAAGEGTNQPTDLDAFDQHYRHMFLWHPASHQIAGAYRLGATDEILPALGKKGLYTHTLFRIHDRFFFRLGPALELGRSFVRVEHQKNYAALLSLWKGIGHYVAENPRYRYLFGPVSISNRYLPVSRRLLVEFLNRHRRARELAGYVKPRSPFGWPWDRGKDFNNLVTADPEEVSAILADIEPDQKGVPVLLRQYLKLGGELLGFNVDRNFSNVVDGLILVDLARTEPRMLERYLGKERAAEFRRFHGCNAAA
jgi:putative hemolysin